MQKKFRLYRRATHGNRVQKTQWDIPDKSIKSD